MLSSKPWQLTGEIEGQRRPENSLLEEYLQFDRNTRLRMSKTRRNIS
jgi:U3 small nucleolar ribonucleoprotein component